MTLSTVLRRATVRRLADERAMVRGEDYWKDGRVRSLVEFEDKVAARVHGNADYRVRLWAEGERVGYACTCPVGAAGQFCKHCVAAALCWLARDGAGPGALRPDERGRDLGPGDGEGRPAGALRAANLEDVQAYLLRKDREELVGLVLERALEDDALRRHLLLRVAVEGPRGPDVATLRAAIDEAVEVDEPLPYPAVAGYARGIWQVVDAIGRLLRPEQRGAARRPDPAPAVVGLAEYALRAIERAMGQVHDPDGRLLEIVHHLEDLHLRACQRARSAGSAGTEEAEALARRLFAWEMGSEHGTFQGAAATYAEVLGPAGVALYRRLAEEAWDRVPPLLPGQQEADAAAHGRRARLAYLMETVAWQRGDMDELVTIKARDLSSAASFLEIAQIERHRGRADEALRWAERGIAAFPRRTDFRLREFAADEYHRRGRHDEAMALIWAEFADWPTLERYQVLKEHAGRAGQVSLHRDRAVGLLRDRAWTVHPVQPRPGGRGQGQAEGASATGRDLIGDRSELVRILLWEGEVEAAWQEAQAGGCSDEVWMELARRREAASPEDALGVYRRQVDRVLGRKTNEAYEEAVQLVHKVRGLFTRLGRGAEFLTYLGALRATHRPKRNFMRLLDRTDWGAG